MRGICWMAPNAAPYAQAIMIVVTMVVRAELAAEELGEARTLERARRFLLAPGRRLRQERADHDQRDRGHDARHQRVAPGVVRAADQRQRVGVGHDQVVGAGHHQAAHRSERLRVADHRLALLRIGEELGEPRDRRDKLHAHADEHAAAPEEQLVRPWSSSPAASPEMA